MLPFVTLVCFCSVRFPAFHKAEIHTWHLTCRAVSA